MKLAVALSLVCACGRIGFDSVQDSDGGRDGAPYVEPGGQPDPGFGSGGYTVVGTGVDTVAFYDVITRESGGFLGVGPNTNGGSYRMGLFAVTDNGALDPSFGSAGTRDIGPTSSDFGYGLLRLADRRVLVNGDGDNGSGSMDDITVGLVDEAGTPDVSFNGNGFHRVDILGARQPDTSQRAAQLGSDVVVCGAANYAATDSHFALVALGLDGALDAGFGTGGVVSVDFSATAADTCNDVLALPNGNLAAVGETGMNALLVSYRTDGTRDPTFAGGAVVSFGNPFAVALALTSAPDGDLVAAGQSNNSGMIARFAPDGTPRASFGVGGVVEMPSVGLFTGVIVQPNGKIIAVGESISLGGVIMRVTADGVLDPTFATGGVFELQLGLGDVQLTHAVFAPNGDIVAVGYVGASLPHRGVIVRLR